jgi:hypothetical protein
VLDKCVDLFNMDHEIELSMLLANPFARKTFIEKKMIIARGRPTPEIPDMQKACKGVSKMYNRHFNPKHYDSIPWLTGSALLKKLYCWPCVLFSTTPSTWTKEGFNNLNMLTVSGQRHQRSQNHVRCQLQMATFGASRIELQLDEQQRIEVSRHNKLVAHNRSILQRLIDSVCHLAKQELAFRGHDEGKNSLNKGNYVELLELIATYDALLKSHLDTATVFRGTSNHVQNDLIDAVSSVVLNKIKLEVSTAPFVAILLDETTDVMNCSQLSTVLRYVTDDGLAQERFIGFTDVSSNKSAEGLYNHVLKIVQEFQLQDKLIAQSYDGAAVMAGQLNGLCTRVLETFPRAFFVHCFAHRLNLVLQQVCMSVKECRVFFSTLSGLAAFFSRSPKRSQELKTFMDRKLPAVAPTRWVFTSRLVITVSEFHVQLIEFFESLLENAGDWDAGTIVQAQGFLSFLTDMQSVFLLIAFSNMFIHTDMLYKVLQEKSLDIVYCYKTVLETQANLKKGRESFETLWEEVLRKSEECGIEHPRPRRKRADAEGTAIDSYRRIYFEIVDTICTQLDDRFRSMQRLHFVSLLNPDLFEPFNLAFPDAIFKKFEEYYSGLFDFLLLKNELTVMYSWEEFRGKHPHALIKYMNTHKLKTSMPQIYNLGCLILTIPSTTATVERSFSALKRIKSHVRATQGQVRMSNLSLLSIEKSVLCDLKGEKEFHAKVTDVFSKQDRRMDFNFK